MGRQHGVSLSQLLVWSFLLVIVALFAMKVVPSALEYSTILKDAKKVAVEASPQASVAEIRKAFGRYVEIDNIKSLTPQELEISKNGNEIVIEFAYTQKIPLAGPTSLLIEYQGSTIGKSRGE